MRTICHRKLLIWATLSLLLVIMVGSKTFAAKLLASDGGAHDNFGASISTSGDVIIVGAAGDGYSEPYYSGLAYVYRWNGTNWLEEQKLFASDGDGGDYFGVSVSVSGNVAVVGASGDDDQGTNSGAVYVFRYNADTHAWEPEQKLLASDGAGKSDYFGFSVSISGDEILVGAVFATELGVPLDKEYTGAAYIFRYDGDTGTWKEEQKLLPSDRARFDFIGFSVSISGDMALVGAPNEDEKAVAAGAAYVFHHDAANGWVELPKLLPSDGIFNAQFATSLFINGDVAVVGAPGAYPFDYTGTAFVYRWNGNNWLEEQKLHASDGFAEEMFGRSVFISGDMVLVGAFADLVNGAITGSAYVYRHDAVDGWVEQKKLLAPDGAADDRFGGEVSIVGDMAVVGAFADDDQGTDSGSVYVFNDYDSDGITNCVDEELFTPSLGFSDRSLGGATSGQILSLDSGITIEILDAYDPAEGIMVLVSGPPTGVAEIRIDGSQATYKLNPGQYILTSGSVTLKVVEGAAEVEISIGGGAVLIQVEGTAFIVEITVGEELQELVVQAVEGSVILNGEVVDPGNSVTTIKVPIDIKPGNDPNCFNANGKGVIPVAIFSTEDFDATQVDPTTISLEGQEVRVVGKGNMQAHIEDMNGNGLNDLIVQIEDLDGAFQAGTTTATLTGQTFSGISIVGADTICIVP